MVRQNLRRPVFFCADATAENLLGSFRPGPIPDTLSTSIVVDVLSSSHSGVEFSFTFANRLCVSVWRFFLVGIGSFWADGWPLLDLRVQSAYRPALRCHPRDAL